MMDSRSDFPVLWQERVRALHKETLDTIYANKVFIFQRDRYARQIFFLRLGAEACTIVGGASGLGAALKHSSFGWIALACGAVGTILVRALKEGSFIKRESQASNLLAAYTVMETSYRQFVDDLNARRAWTVEDEKRLESLRLLERKASGMNPLLPEIETATKMQIKQSVKLQEPYKTWWRPYDDQRQNPSRAASG